MAEGVILVTLITLLAAKVNAVTRGGTSVGLFVGKDYDGDPAPGWEDNLRRVSLAIPFGKIEFHRRILEPAAKRFVRFEIASYRHSGDCQVHPCASRGRNPVLSIPRSARDLDPGFRRGDGREHVITFGNGYISRSTASLDLMTFPAAP